jgi:iron complex transport system substrate-binding protein
MSRKMDFTTARRRRRTAGVGVAVALALATAACSGADARGGASASGSAPEPASRTITHAMGTTTVPATPARVVVLDTQELDVALSLGVTPVGAVRTDVGTELPTFLEGKVPAGSIAMVGTIQQPNLEAIAALRPDLILSSKVRHEALYPKLAKIAPTVFAEKTGDAWKANLSLFGEALGKKAEAEQRLADYEARAKALGEQIGAAKISLSLVRWLPGEIRLYSPRSFSGSVLADVGFQRPAFVNGTKEIAVNVSPEQIAKADADVIFTTTYGPPADTDKAKTANLWSQLTAVKADKAFEVSDDSWMLAIGPTGADLILADLQKHLG